MVEKIYKIIEGQIATRDFAEKQLGLRLTPDSWSRSDTTNQIFMYGVITNNVDGKIQTTKQYIQ